MRNIYFLNFVYYLGIYRIDVGFDIDDVGQIESC